MSSTKVEYGNRIEWYLNGQRHRTDGPAIEWSDGSKEWYLNGNSYSVEQWQKEVMRIKLKRLSEL